MTADDLSSNELAVLELLVEDDYGLWEVAQHADGVRGLRRKSLAVVIVKSRSDDDPVPAGQSGLRVDLEDLTLWTIPEANEPQLLVRATSAGQQAWNRHVGSGGPTAL